MTRAEGGRDRTGRRALSWLLDRAFAVRPLLWIPAVAIFGAGRAWGIREHGHRGFSAAPAASLLLILAAVHAANAWRDQEGDRINRKGLPVGSGAVDGATLLTLSVGSVVAATVLALGASILERWLLAASLILGLAYVAPPLELKRRPLFDALSHGARYGLVAFLLGAAGSGGLDPGGSVRRALAAALLAPQSPAPLVLAVLLGGASEVYNRWRWGVSYPLRAFGGGA